MGKSDALFGWFCRRGGSAALQCEPGSCLWCRGSTDRSLGPHGRLTEGTSLKIVLMVRHFAVGTGKGYGAAVRCRGRSVFSIAEVQRMVGLATEVLVTGSPSWSAGSHDSLAGRNDRFGGSAIEAMGICVCLAAVGTWGAGAAVWCLSRQALCFPWLWLGALIRQPSR